MLTAQGLNLMHVKQGQMVQHLYRIISDNKVISEEKKTELLDMIVEMNILLHKGFNTQGKLLRFIELAGKLNEVLYTSVSYPF